MRALTGTFGFLIALALAVGIGLVAQQNPQAVSLSLYGQTLSLNAGLAVAGAAGIGALAVLFLLLPLLAASGRARTATASTSAQTEQDLMVSRQQYLELQAAHIRLQGAYNEVTAERERWRAFAHQAPTAERARAAVLVVPQSSEAAAAPAQLAPTDTRGDTLAMPPARRLILDNDILARLSQQPDTSPPPANGKPPDTSPSPANEKPPDAPQQ
jgi:uncharacterized integral membrane protein